MEIVELNHFTWAKLSIINYTLLIIILSVSYLIKQMVRTRREANFNQSLFSINIEVSKNENSTFNIQHSTFFNIRLSRKEVFQPHLPVRLPCYDLAPITSFALGRSLRSRTSGAPGFHGLTGGVYKARERIHRAMADARLLANPASWGRVADPSPNWDRL